MNKYNKINLYKNNLIKFIDTQNNNIIKIKNIIDIDYIVGILFLTQMNIYCKQYKIQIHGYYIAFSFINLFSKIRKKLVKSNKLNYNDIYHFWLSIANNIDYFNSRVDKNSDIKIKINNNFSKLIIEFNQIFYDIVNNDDNLNSDSKKNTENSNSKEYLNINYNIKCHFCYIYEILKKFFYILLITAKFMGSGEIKDPNLIKLAEYYTNIFYIYIKYNNIDKNNINEEYYFELFNNYIEYKNKLNYSIIELKLNSDTIDEIIEYLDNNISNFLH
jgi:hypothetical protein